MKRLFDIVAAALGLLVAAPVLLAAAIAIKWASPGPVFYVAKRAGRDGTPFGMFKLRTMHVRAVHGAVITAPGDPRIFPLGKILRRTKLDELPQLLNVLRGDMSIVGPRPEDPAIVRDHYTDWMRETLRVRPGLTSPGAIYGYLYEDQLIDPADPERSYVSRLLPAKLAVEYDYLGEATLLKDVAVLGGTIRLVAGRAIGWRPKFGRRK